MFYWLKKEEEIKERYNVDNVYDIVLDDIDDSIEMDEILHVLEWGDLQEYFKIHSEEYYDILRPYKDKTLGWLVEEFKFGL